jgi:hypothetical protein
MAMITAGSSATTTFHMTRGIVSVSLRKGEDAMRSF